jgi:hypothetical protein
MTMSIVPNRRYNQIHPTHTNITTNNNDGLKQQRDQIES